MPKQRKYQITPNSINASEEASVRSVLDKFRNRAIETDQNETLGAQETDDRAPNAPDFGRPSLAVVDAQQNTNLTPNLETFGHPDDISLGAQSSLSVAPNGERARRPNSESLGAVHEDGMAPKTREIGRQDSENLGANTPDASIRAPKINESAGAKAPKSETLGAQNKVDWDQYDKKRLTERVALRPNAAILKKVKVYCAENDHTLTEFFELSSLKFMELGAQLSAEGGAKTPLDNRRLMMMFKTKPFIINLYLAYTAAFNEAAQAGPGKWNGKWHPRDDQAGMVFNEVDPRIVELGILQTQGNKGVGTAKIQTFQYYVGEISGWIESGLGDAAMNDLLKHYRRKIAGATGREVDLSFLEEGK